MTEAVPADAGVPPTEEVAKTEEEEAKPLLTIYLLETTKAAQDKNGLRHHDYLRYRQYCCRKLRRIRRGKQIKLTHGRGRRYTQRVVTADMVTEERHLHIPLFNAERAWSYAMQLKQDDQLEDNPRLRFHLVKRLRKAAEWAANLKQLCRERCDERTYLEAHAYCEWMHGTYYLEREEWSQAYESFERARMIYEQLTKVGSRDQRNMFTSRLEDIQPSLRYCKYNVERSGGVTSSADLRDMLAAAEGSELLQANLDRLLAEARRTQAETMSEVDWRGHGVPVRSEKLRLAILAAQDKADAVDQAKRNNSRTLQDKFTELIGACEDALRIAISDVARLTKAGRTAQVGEATQLEAYVRRMKLQATYDRNLHLIRQSTENHAGADDATTKMAEDAVALYTRAMRNVVDMQELPGYAEDAADTKLLGARQHYLRAFRATWSARVFAAQMQWVEAVAMLQLASECAAAAVEGMDSLTSTEATRAGADMRALILAVRKETCIAQAHAVLSTMPKSGSLNKALATSSSVTAKTVKATLAATDRLSRFEAGPLAPIPPAMQAVPCKPLHFDLAVHTLAFPKLTKRMKMSKSVHAKKSSMKKKNKKNKDKLVATADAVVTAKPTATRQATAAASAPTPAASSSAAPAPAPAPAPASANEEQEQGGGGWLGWLTGR